jgi:hypothetical protein
MVVPRKVYLKREWISIRRNLLVLTHKTTEDDLFEHLCIELFDRAYVPGVSRQQILTEHGDQG